MFCRSCGHQGNENAEICTNCGIRPLNGEKHCQSCGVETKEKQELCISCGMRLEKMNPVEESVIPTVEKTEDQDAEKLVKAASCCFPVVGLVLYFVWKKDKPTAAKSVCRWAGIGFGAGALIYVLGFLLTACTAAVSNGM